MWFFLNFLSESNLQCRSLEYFFNYDDELHFTVNYIVLLGKYYIYICMKGVKL